MPETLPTTLPHRGPLLPESEAAAEGADRVQAWPWRRLTLFVLTAAGLVLTLSFAATLLLSLTGAFALAVVLRPLQRTLQRRMRPALAAALLVMCVTAALLGPGILLGRKLVHEATHAVRFLNHTADWDRDGRFARRHHRTAGWIDNGLSHLAPGSDRRKLAAMAFVPVTHGARHVFEIAVQLALMLVFLFFLLRDAARAEAAALDLIPLPRSVAEPFLGKLAQVTHAIFLGRFAIAALQGFLSGAMYAVLRVPGALLWGTLTGLLSLIPAFGALLVWMPIVLYLGFTASWTKACLLAVWCGLIISNIDNVLYSIAVGNRTDLPTPVVLVAIFGGLVVLGVPGFVLGPVIVAATLLLLKVWREQLLEEPSLPLTHPAALPCADASSVQL